MNNEKIEQSKARWNKERDTAIDKWNRLVEATGRSSVTWNDADPTMLRDAVAAATEDGAALLFAKTSDGGALVVKVINDKKSVPLYPASTQSLHSTLELIAQIANKP